jgi:plastocyanin
MTAVVFSILNVQYAFATSCALMLTQPSLKSINGGESEATAGEQLIISTTITNHCYEQDQPFVAIIEVRNSDGVTEYLSWQSGVLKGLTGNIEIGVSWIPAYGDNYELRAFVISSLENPQVLSRVEVSNITIAAQDSGRVIVVIPNDPDPSLQQSSFEHSAIKVVLGVNSTVTFVNQDSVPHRLVVEHDSADQVAFQKYVFVPSHNSFVYDFTDTGVFLYSDRDRGWMHGYVDVLQ